MNEPIPRDPYRVLGLRPDASDAAIREAYLNLVQQHPPEREPERFAVIREAYERIRDLDRRTRYRLFGDGRWDTVEALVEELVCQTQRRRHPLEALLGTLRPPS